MKASGYGGNPQAYEDLKYTRSFISLFPKVQVEHSNTHVMKCFKLINVFTIIVTCFICIFCLQNNPSLLLPWMIYTCFYIFASVVSYVINTVAYTEAGEPLLAGVSVIGAILNLCKYVLY
jgi:hypothetical protein